MIRTRALALAGMVLAGCGARAAGRGTTGSGGAPAATDAQVEEWLTGEWRWTHASNEDNVQRVEVEDWSLAAAGAQVTGSYRRRVVIMSLDGRPFRCSQTLSYQLDTRYALSGRAARGAVELDEVAFDTDSSPCDSGHRGTAHYQVAAAPGGELQLRWPGGSQTLHRRAGPAARTPRAPTATGTWRWSNRVVDSRGQTRVELETWRIEEAADGGLRGSYQRRVSRLAEDGVVVGCPDRPGDDVDRIDVSGWRDGDEVQLGELSAAHAPGSCADGPRHLDAAVGTFYGDLLELTWRGRNRQVLERAQ